MFSQVFVCSQGGLHSHNTTGRKTLPQKAEPPSQKADPLPSQKTDRLSFQKADPLRRQTPPSQRIWMLLRDTVNKLIIFRMKKTTFAIITEFSIRFLFQARIASLLTLIIDILIPFVSISTLNAILIRAVRQRSKELESFTGSGTISTVTAEATSDINKRQ